MGQARIKIGLLGAGLAIGLVLLVLAYRPRMAPLSRAVATLQQHPTPVPTAAATPAAAASATEEPSRLADGLGDAAGSAAADLRILNGVFSAYRGALREGNPVGENAEITAALRGRNRLGFAFIPNGCPAVDSHGELCDRWGTPYFFHQLSGERMEVRSAGPDHRLWTADDVVFTP